MPIHIPFIHTDNSFSKFHKAIFGYSSFYRQADAMDYHPPCLKMITEYYRLDRLCQMYFIFRKRVNMLGISELAVKIITDKLEEKLPLWTILHWNHSHFVVLHKIRKVRIRVNYEKLLR